MGLSLHPYFGAHGFESGFCFFVFFLGGGVFIFKIGFCLGAGVGFTLIS